MFLYKPYVISSEPVFIQKEVKFLEKTLKTLQSPTKTIPFLPLFHYKEIWQNREKDIQYWKEIAVEFIKQKYNSDTSQWRFLIEMFSEELLHKSFFIALTS